MKKLYDEYNKSNVGDEPQPTRTRNRSKSLTPPSWLLVSISDMEERIKMMASNSNGINEEDNADVTFGERAEYYYRKRPQLLALLQDLNNRYLYLADRYSQSLAKHQKHKFDSDQEECFGQFDINNDIDNDGHVSEADQQHPPKDDYDNEDEIIAEVVMKGVEYEIVLDELGSVDQKVELQKSLLEVLESERVILLNENARLSYKMRALVEENKGLAAECLFMKRKAGELARCVLKMREDHRVCVLGRKIELLQGQIYGLEKRNKEYFDKLVMIKQEQEKKRSGDDVVTLDDCFHVDEQQEEEGGGSVSTSTSNSSTSLVHAINGRKIFNSSSGRKIFNSSSGGGKVRSKKKVSHLWDWLKNFDMFMCGPHFDSTCC